MYYRIASTLLTLTLFSRSALASEPWPQFRGPTGQGLSTAKDVPVEWSPQKNVAWRIPIPGSGWSSPVISDGKVYLTTSLNESSPSLRALCLSYADGKIVWDVEVFNVSKSAVGPLHKKNTLASATPIIAGNRLYVHFGHLGTAALDPATGNVLWRQTIKYSPVHGNGGSPVLVDDLLIFNCDAAQNPFLIALDCATGQTKWKTPRSIKAKMPFSFSTPLLIEVNGQNQLLSPASGMIGSYEPTTGRELWRVTYPEGYSVVPRPVFAHDMVFTSTSFDNPIVYAIRPQGARGDVTKTHVAWTNRRGAPSTPSLLVLGNEIYFVSDNGIATCADARTGKVHWTERLDGNFSASPVAAEGRIYFANETGVAYVIKAGTRFEKLAENDLGEGTLASYAVDDGTLLIRSAKHLWRIGSPSK